MSLCLSIKILSLIVWTLRNTFEDIYIHSPDWLIGWSIVHPLTQNNSHLVYFNQVMMWAKGLIPTEQAESPGIFFKPLLHKNGIIVFTTSNQHQIIFFTCAKCVSERPPYSETLTYKPLTNNVEVKYKIEK